MAFADRLGSGTSMAPLPPLLVAVKPKNRGDRWDRGLWGRRCPLCLSLSWPLAPRRERRARNRSAANPPAGRNRYGTVPHLSLTPSFAALHLRQRFDSQHGQAAGVSDAPVRADENLPSRGEPTPTPQAHEPLHGGIP